MDLIRLLSSLSVTTILTVSLLSGPSVGLLGLAPENPEVVLGNGSADIEVESVPDTGRLYRARYASSGYVLSVPSVTVDVSNLSGNPMVIYKLHIPELWYVAGTNHVLDKRFTGKQTLTLDEPVLNRTSLERETYRGELLVIKRAHEVDTVLYRGNVTLRVG